MRYIQALLLLVELLHHFTLIGQELRSDKSLDIPPCHLPIQDAVDVNVDPTATPFWGIHQTQIDNFVPEIGRKKKTGLQLWYQILPHEYAGLKAIPSGSFSVQNFV